MKWKDIKIGRKLALGFGCMVVLLMITSYAGFDGIKTVSHALIVVGDEEAPVVDMAMEMKIALWAARNSMEEFKGAASALATDDASALESIEKNYNMTLDDFVEAYSKAHNDSKEEFFKFLSWYPPNRLETFFDRLEIGGSYLGDTARKNLLRQVLQWQQTIK